MTSYRETNITKKKKLGKNTVIVRSPVYGYASMLASRYYFDKKFKAHFQPTFIFSKYE